MWVGGAKNKHSWKKTQGGAGCYQSERTSPGASSFFPGLQCILAVEFVFFRGSLPKNQ